MFEVSELEAWVARVMALRRIPGLALVALRQGEVCYAGGFGVASTEAAAGKPFTALVYEWVFTPLRMLRSTFDPLVAMTYPLAQGHEADGEGEPRVSHRFADNPAHYPSGFALSSVLDLANCAAMLLRGGEFGGRRLLLPETVALMQAPHADSEEEGVRYGLAFSLREHRGMRRVSHDGAIPHFRAEFTLLPDQGAGLILLWNSLAGGPEVLVGPILDRLTGRNSFRP